MLNYIWGGMILLGILVASFTGNMEAVTNETISSSKNAISLLITMFGVISMWSGVMNIAEKAGLIDVLSKKMMPLLKILFKELDEKKDKKAFKYIATNMIANIFGLGMAATPAGINAIKEMQKNSNEKQRATNSMCMFMIINMSSLQLITMNIIAFRSQYDSINPSEIIGPGILTTLVSTMTGIAVAKIFEIRSCD